MKARDTNLENWNREKSESHFIIIGLTFIADSIQRRLGTTRSNMFYICMQYFVLLPLIVSVVFVSGHCAVVGPHFIGGGGGGRGEGLQPRWGGFTVCVWP